MSLSLEGLESLYFVTLAKADINNPDHMAILWDLRERIQKAKAGTRKIENAGSPVVYGNTSTGKVEGVITKGPLNNTISEKIEFPGPTNVVSKKKVYNIHTGPKFTKELVQDALNKYPSVLEAGMALGMKDPNYIYQLIRKYGLVKVTRQQKLPL